MVRSLTAALFLLLLLALLAAAETGRPLAVGPVASEPLPPALDAYPWPYLRQGRPLAQGESLVSVIAVGDILLGRGVAAQAGSFSLAAPWLAGADLTLGNLEGVLVEGGTPRAAPAGDPQPIILSASPSSAVLLPRAGFDILSLANNHALDYGGDGLRRTIDHLHAAGLDVVGIAGASAAAGPLFRELNGLRLAFLAFNAVPDPHPQLACPDASACTPRPATWDPATSPAAIAAARAQSDAVIVSVHWGFEYQPLPDPQQEAVAAAMLNAGADLVLGHHPHVPQKISLDGDRLVAYSLGNFLFDQGGGQLGTGLALRAFFDSQGLRAVQALPLHAGLRPRLSTMSEAESWLSPLLPPPPRIGYTCTAVACLPADVPQTEQNGRFYSGRIDLTGDGQAETVRLSGDQVTIYEEGTAVWTSPPAWRVVDAALGDPNNDGRYEIMLAIWQKDAAGHERSQPYIVGHRGGRYALLWGGRPVVDPIQELDVADIDGDGSDELVVIEELAGGSARALSLWRWTGWTFSLVWRGDDGRYSDLLLLDRREQPLISVVSAPGKFSFPLDSGK